MNIDAFTKGLQRANANRKQRQVKQQDANAVSNKPVLTKHAPAFADASAFDLEHYRVEIITKAIAYITNNKQREMKHD
ncbi:hypothetical protein [Pseudomonas putida]|uniref:hypothetical protein n=1 Tax=Pseudomonas putida TaxID=303 RepID=UPI003F799094